MKRYSLLVVAVIFVVGTGWLIADRRSLTRADQDPKKPIEIPLKSIYSTSRQEGLKRVDQGEGDESFANEFLKLYRKSIDVGPSNVFLAQGDDIGAAVKATLEVFTGYPVDEPVQHDVNVKSEKCWLVVYLGSAGSDPPRWPLNFAQRDGKRIRLSLTTSKLIGTTTDVHPYFVWVPLGKLGPGSYTLELYDEDQKDVRLMRKVTIPKS